MPSRHRDVPIGNLTSQLFADWYMHAVDDFVKRTLGWRHYVRCMDELVFVGPGRVPRLLGDELVLARADGSYAKLMQSLARTDLLILDDWGLAPLGDSERRDLLELVEDRVGRNTTLVTIQPPVDHWHEMIGEPTFGDAILDRIVNHAHRLTFTGGSLRRHPTPESPTD